MFKTSKGEAVLLDFALALFLFIIIWVFITSDFNSQANNLLRENDFSSMQVKADYMLELLVKSPGVPQNWETLSVDDINLLGLAKTDRELSESKLASFSNFSTTYEDLKTKIPLDEYDFFFEFEGLDDVNAGLAPQANANMVVAQRIVTYKGGIGIAKLTLYKLT